MPNKIYAYLRVSSRTQNEIRQITMVKEHYNIPDENIVVEKASGKSYIDRAEYQRLKRKLRPGDLLVICSLDRLGRDMKATAKEWDDLTAMGIDIDVLDMPLLNTRNNQAGLTGELINKLVIAILSYVGEKERLAIRERQQEGIKANRAKNLPYGRPKKVDVDKKFIKYVNEGRKACEVQKLCGISKPTYYRWLKILEASKNKYDLYGG